MLIDKNTFSRSRILVVGDLMLDRYWYGDSKRISPEAPVPVVGIGEIEARAGGAANVALNIASLGADVHLLGGTGDDEAADILASLLQTAQVTCHFVRSAHRKTITKLRVISRHQQLIRLDFENQAEHYHDALLTQRFAEVLADCAVVIFSDYGKGALQNIEQLIALAKAQNKKIFVDPKGNDFEKYRQASVITPNFSEFEAVVGVCENESDIAIKGQQLLEQLSLEALLVTRGEQGMSLIQHQRPVLHLPTQAREVYDVTGAGDTVISVLAASVAGNKSFEEATLLANVAAGIVVGKLGTAVVTYSALNLALKAEQEHDLGVVSLEALIAAVHDAHQRKEKIVMTNGCFDILHAGHVSYLEQARRMGDRLIVAVNDDASVARLKGFARPINPLSQRMAVLAGLASVDWVIAFSENTPETSICQVKPDVLVKGGDYQVTDIAGYDCVTAHGGEVKVLHFVDGCSTSQIITRIKNLERITDE